MINSLFKQVIQGPFESYQFIINLIVGLCVAAVFIAVGIDFMEFQGRKNVKNEKKSVVETGTMILFFFFFYYLIKQRIGGIQTGPFIIRYVLSGIGVLIVILGCIVNIKGRLSLGENWANQIKIYHDHRLVQTGVYRVVRHPLYASLIWMFYGACLIHLNASAFIANTIIFLPFMYYRARQEEDLLRKQFSEYQDYQSVTGMFFPKIVKRRRTNAGV
jgi:protein-S-isoprenylcysteine O-methyltransferase Ste14